MSCNSKVAMKRLLLLGGIGLGLAFTSQAQVRVALPVGAGFSGCSMMLPLRVDASTNLAGFQCDVLFDDSCVTCDGVQFVSGTPGVVVDGKVVHACGVPSRDKVNGWL